LRPGKQGVEIKPRARLLSGTSHDRDEGNLRLDLGTFITGPHCITILGEFGVEVIKVVIKVEPPNTGDSLRRLGTNTDCGETLVWLSEARNKKSPNLATEHSRDVLRHLVAKCDIIVENFRPGALEKWDLASRTPSRTCLVSRAPRRCQARPRAL
jgi:crotonobetainyl-CoA:carnitine CoA-transferase CaiB-like acyl-CoA transferase